MQESQQQAMHITNRTIWTAWYQGYDQAPPIVLACLESWRRLNPGWHVVALDRRLVTEWVDLTNLIDVNRRDLTVQVLSDILRLCLLRRYGGVWVDSTVYCCRPLDVWLGNVYGSGFFSFRNPGPDRLLSNWMLAAEQGNPILSALYDAYLQIWQTTYFSHQEKRFGKLVLRKLSSILNKNAERATWWTAPIIRKTMRVYPYFIFHYTFNRVILSDPELLRLWKASAALDASLPHRLQQLADAGEGKERAIAEIAQGIGNVQKLNWRVDAASPYWAAVLAALKSETRQPKLPSPIGSRKSDDTRWSPRKGRSARPCSAGLIPLTMSPPAYCSDGSEASSVPRAT
jgi:hypothetical protein